VKISKAVALLIAGFSSASASASPNNAFIYGTLTSWEQSGAPSRSNPGIGSLIVIEMGIILNGSLDNGLGGFDVECDVRSPDNCYSSQAPGSGNPPGSNVGFTSIPGLLPWVSGGICSYAQQGTYARAGGLFDYTSQRLCETTFYPQMYLRFSLTDVPYDSAPIANLSLARASGLIGGSGSFLRLEGPGLGGAGAAGELYGSYGGTFSLYAINYIPAPATVGLFVLGLIGIGVAGRKQA
jgi:hypothetical protein